jgi:hypothetical protein
MSSVTRTFYLPSRDTQEILQVTCDNGLINNEWTLIRDDDINNDPNIDLRFTPVCIDVLAIDHQTEVILVAEDASIGRILVGTTFFVYVSFIDCPSGCLLGVG